MMYLRIMPACSLQPAWPVPSSAKYPRAVNWASMRFNHDALDGVQPISTLFAFARGPGPAVPPGGQVRAEVIADDRDPDR
jgi:hypothetical protein